MQFLKNEGLYLIIIGIIVVIFFGWMVGKILETLNEVNKLKESISNINNSSPVSVPVPVSSSVPFYFVSNINDVLIESERGRTERYKTRFRYYTRRKKLFNDSIKNIHKRNRKTNVD